MKEGCHDPIITAQQFDRVQLQIGKTVVRRMNLKKPMGRVYLLSGLLRCQCGAHMVGAPARLPGPLGQVDPVLPVDPLRAAPVLRPRPRNGPQCRVLPQPAHDRHRHAAGHRPVRPLAGRHRPARGPGSPTRPPPGNRSRATSPTDARPRSTMSICRTKWPSCSRWWADCPRTNGGPSSSSS